MGHSIPSDVKLRRLRVGSYGWMTDSEFLALIAARIGHSPLIDELASRLDAIIGYDEDVSNGPADDLGPSVAAYLPFAGIEVTSDSDTITFSHTCPVCEASHKTTLNLEED